jgi:hypothetical protein
MDVTMTEAKLADAWVSQCLGIDPGAVRSVQPSVPPERRRGVALSLSGWRSEAGRAKSALGAVRAEMLRRGRPDSLDAAEAIGETEQVLDVVIDDGRSARILKELIESDEVLSQVDDILHLRTPLLDALGDVVDAYGEIGG